MRSTDTVRRADPQQAVLYLKPVTYATWMHYRHGRNEILVRQQKDDEARERMAAFAAAEGLQLGAHELRHSAAEKDTYTFLDNEVHEEWYCYVWTLPQDVPVPDHMRPFNGKSIYYIEFPEEVSRE